MRTLPSSEQDISCLSKQLISNTSMDTYLHKSPGEVFIKDTGSLSGVSPM